MSRNMAVSLHSIIFDNVSHYYDDSQLAIDNMSLKIKAGEKIAIIGESGSGKSTIGKLILGILESSHGNLYLNGQLRSKGVISTEVNYVPQESAMFNRSVLENVGYANSNVAIDHIQGALEKSILSQYSDEIGLQTPVGEGGSNVSGGQKQRLSIARAFIKENSPIVVLDEATSALDPSTSVLVNDTIFTEFEDKTVVLITHDYALLRYVNRVIVIADGQIIQDDTVSSVSYPS